VSLTPLRVLILEDDPNDAELLVQEFRRVGFEPDWQRVEGEADYLAGLDPGLDIILADYHQPQFNASRALEHLREHELDIPFVVVTGVFEEKALECLQRGATDYLLKDRLGRLGSAVAHALEQKQLRDARRRAHASLRESEERFRSLVQNVSDVISVLEADGTIRYISPSVQQLLSYLPTELVGTSGWGIVHPGDLARVQADIERTLTRLGAAERIEFRARHRDGSIRFVEANATNLLDDPSVRGIILTSRDITERKRFEEQLAQQAYSDELTGLPNRRLFMERLSRALAHVSGPSRHVTVMLLDLDRFKVINDTLGHSVGDQLLSSVGDRLSDALQGHGLVARFGGDEFAVLLDGLPDRSHALSSACGIAEAFKRVFTLPAHEVFTTTSIGIALGKPGSITPGEMLRDADIALYRAKAQGRGQFAVYDALMSEQALENLELEGELRLAVEHDELQLYYQPEVNLRTGAISGMEALVRWQHPRRGLILPDEFIPLAEDTGLISAIGRWVLEEACRQGRVWQEFAGPRSSLTMSVNLSAKEFQLPGIVEQVADTLRRSDLSPSALKLEITESTMMLASQATSRTLRTLKSLGVLLAIDDFGTGYSSLAYLRRFPVDTLKIDQSFVAGLKRKTEDLAIVQAVAGLANALGMDITAEGIETDGQRRLLAQLRCDRGQGYYFSRPLPKEAMEALLQAGASFPGPRSHVRPPRPAADSRFATGLASLASAPNPVLSS